MRVLIKIVLSGLLILRPLVQESCSCGLRLFGSIIPLHAHECLDHTQSLVDDRKLNPLGGLLLQLLCLVLSLLRFVPNLPQLHFVLVPEIMLVVSLSSREFQQELLHQGLRSVRWSPSLHGRRLTSILLL